MFHDADILWVAIRRDYRDAWTFYLKSVPAQFLKLFKTYFLSYQRDKFVKTAVQPSSSLPEHQLQPSSSFVATIMMANIFYIE